MHIAVPTILAGAVLAMAAGAIVDSHTQAGPFSSAYAEPPDDGAHTYDTSPLIPLSPAKSYAHPPPLQQTGVSPYEVLCNEPRELYVADSRPLCLFPGTQQALLLRGIDSVKAPPMPAAVDLSIEEETWLSDNPVIRVAYDKTWYPIEYADDSGWVAGTVLGYIVKFEEALGVDFEPVQTADWTDVLNSIRDGNADVIFMVAYTDDRAEYMGFTTPHYTVNTALATTKEGSLTLDDPGLRLLTMRNFEIEDWLDNNYPDVSYTSVDGFLEGLAMLQNGEADAMAAAWPVISAIAGRDGITVYNAGATGHSYELSIGYRNDQLILGSILQKTLDYIPASTLERLQGDVNKMVDIPTPP